MKSAKKIFQIVWLAIILSYSGKASAGMPVIDFAAVAAAIQQVFAWYQQATDMIEELNYLEDQIAQAEREYNSMTGSRLLGMIANDIRDVVPTDANTTYSNVYTRGYGGLSPQGKTFRDRDMIYNCAGESSDYSTICEKQLNLNAQDMSFYSDAFDSANDRTVQIESLQAQINGTDDPKAIAELQARIQIETVAVNNQQSRVAILENVSAANHRAAEQQSAEWYIESTNRPSVLTNYRPTPR